MLGGSRAGGGAQEVRQPRCRLAGGCWAQAEMKEPLRSLVQLPVDAEGLAARLPERLRPPGL